MTADDALERDAERGERFRRHYAIRLAGRLHVAGLDLTEAADREEDHNIS